MALIYQALFILAYDAWLYWTHRALHRWAPQVHSVHHSKYDITFHVAEHCILWGPLVLSPLLGWTFAIALNLVVFTANLAIHRRLYNWLNFPMRWGLEFWITPSYHKVHHQKAGNKNYALFLTYWDRLCGTRV